MFSTLGWQILGKGANLELGRFGHPSAKRVEDVILQVPEFTVPAALFGMILLDGDVDDAACGCTGWEQDGRELDQVGALAKEYLRVVAR
jgi:hypothetical protein